jgi:3-hydroxy-4-methylanthranilate adenylyltransferase
MGAQMPDLLLDLFDAHPGALPYLSCGDSTLSRDEVDDGAADEESVFRAFDIGPGSTVLLQVPPSYTLVEALIALWRLGAQVMLVDHRLTPAEVATLRGLCRPQFSVRGGCSASASAAN